MQLREREITGVKIIVQPHPYPDTSGTGKSGKRTRRNRIMVIDQTTVTEAGNFLLFALRNHDKLMPMYEEWLHSQPQLLEQREDEEDEVEEDQDQAPTATVSHRKGGRSAPTAH